MRLRILHLIYIDYSNTSDMMRNFQNIVVKTRNVISGDIACLTHITRLDKMLIIQIRTE